MGKIMNTKAMLHYTKNLCKMHLAMDKKWSLIDTVAEIHLLCIQIRMMKRNWFHSD